MSKSQHPLERGAAPELPTLGEGCLRRFDPELMSAEHGTEFLGAAQAWQEYLAAQSQETLESPVSPASGAKVVRSGE